MNAGGSDTNDGSYENHFAIPLAADSAVPCPHCKSSEGLRFDEISLIDLGGDIVPLVPQGSDRLSIVAATIGNSSSPGHRHMIVLPHWCGECGHRGELVLHQQGGQTFGQYRDVDSEP